MVLSRSQEERVLGVLQHRLPGRPPVGYCIAHLATAAQVRHEQHVHLVRLIHAVVHKGECDIQDGGLCTAGGHEVIDTTLIPFAPIHFEDLSASLQHQRDSPGPDERRQLHP
jgi:hypothetical protein